MSTCKGIQPNPDVSGIGIRVNLYITALLMAILPTDTKSKFASLRQVISGGAAVTGVALLITAIAETATNQLSLFHAIYVIHILTFILALGIVIFPGGAYQTTSKTSTLIRLVLAIVLIYGNLMMFIGYGLYVWGTVATFGNSPECNDHIKYVVFFRSVRATAGWLRAVWIAALAIALCILTAIPLVFARGTPKLLQRLAQNMPYHQVLAILLTVRILKILVSVYGVVMLELYGRRNNNLLTSGEQQWTFGQIMALVQILNTLNESLHCLITSAETIKPNMQKIREIWESAAQNSEATTPVYRSALSS